MIINEKEKSADSSGIDPVSDRNDEYTGGTETEDAVMEAEADYIDSMAEIMSEYGDDLEQAFDEGGEAVTTGIPLTVKVSAMKKGFDKAVKQAVTNMTTMKAYNNSKSVNADVRDAENPIATEMRILVI